MPEVVKQLRRSMAIERDVKGVPLGYNSETRECGLSFSSETEEVWRYADYDISQRLKSREYREILNHEDADFDFLRMSGSLLKNHDARCIVGSIEHVENKDNRGYARVRFTSTQAGKDAETEVREGALKCTSFGYEHKPNGRIIPLGEKYTHHGRDIAGPAILTGFRALEITLTPIPADSTTGVGRSKEGSLENTDMPTLAIKPEVRSYCRTSGVKKGLSRAQINALIEDAPESNEEADALIDLAISERSAVQTTPVTASTATTPQNTPLTVSRTLVATIMSRAKLAGCSDEETSSIINAAKDELDAANLILTAVEKRANATGVSGGIRTSAAEGNLDQSQKMIKEVESLLACDFNREMQNKPLEFGNEDDFNFKKEIGPDPVDEYFKEFEQFGIKNAKNQRHREPSYIANTFLRGVGISSADLESMSTAAKFRFAFSQECADLIRDRVVRNNSGVIRLFERDNGNVALSGTASFPSLYENIQNKSLRQMYRRWEPTWMYWAKKGSLRDFKRTSRIAISDAGDLLLQRENEAPRGASFIDEAEYLQLSKYGRMFSFSWEAQVNDDVGGLARTTMAIGQSCMRLPSKLIYTNLLANPTLNADNVAVFNSAHNNINNATASALSATNINSMWVAMKRQVGKVAPLDVQNGGVADNIDLDPKILLIPPEQALAASKLLQPNFFQVASDGGAGAGATFFTGYVDGVKKLTALIEPRLSNSNYTNALTTLYYMIGDPAQVPSWEISFLDGNAEPILVQRQNYQTLGLDTVVCLPVAVAPLEWRSVQYNAGA